MASTGGLTKRRNVNNYQDITGTSSTSETHDDEESRNYDDPERYDEERDDHESKDQKLTIMEEVLLLGLKDREVSSVTCAVV